MWIRICIVTIFVKFSSIMNRGKFFLDNESLDLLIDLLIIFYFKDILELSKCR